MGRQLRRVPMDFNWPLNEAWQGFLNPWYKASHKCEACDGSGYSPEAKESAESWKETEPPTGDGYQLWETVSEGSPVTPVFATSKELAEWLVTNDDSVTKDTTYDQWMRFIEGPGCAPSMIGTNGRIQSGAKAMGTKSD